jgi:hypothetical protein
MRRDDEIHGDSVSFNASVKVDYLEIDDVLRHFIACCIGLVAYQFGASRLYEMFLVFCAPAHATSVARHRGSNLNNAVFVV